MISILGLLLLGPVQSSFAAGNAGSVSEADEKVFREAAAPFLGMYCTKCHGEEKQKGDLNFETLSIDMTNPEIGDIWNNVFAQVQFREMPPGKSKEQPTAPHKTKFLEALDRQLDLHDRGFGLQEKLRLPEYANYLDHKTLFDGSVKEAGLHPGASLAPASGYLRFALGESLRALSMAQCEDWLSGPGRCPQCREKGTP